MAYRRRAVATLETATMGKSQVRGATGVCRNRADGAFADSPVGWCIGSDKIHAD
jgi:hypothetical protein